MVSDEMLDCEGTESTNGQETDMQTVTAAILIRKGKVLIGQRKTGKRMAHLWEFPGGKLEHGETPEQCLAGVSAGLLNKVGLWM